MHAEPPSGRWCPSPDLRPPKAADLCRLTRTAKLVSPNRPAPTTIAVNNVLPHIAGTSSLQPRSIDDRFALAGTKSQRNAHRVVASSPVFDMA